MQHTSIEHQLTEHPKYQKEDVTTNICQIRKWRDRLPLAKVHKHDVPLSMHKMPSTYASTRKAFTIKKEQWAVI